MNAMYSKLFNITERNLNNPFKSDIFHTDN